MKADGDKTYFAGDLAYVDDKLGRGFEHLVYVLGSDHHGYIGRLKAAAACLGHDPARMDVITYQLITVSGERMGKRRGNVVSLDELVEAIGVDAARFFLVQRSHDQALDIDTDLATESSSKNPVYYVQYAHARASRLIRLAAEEDGAVVGDPSRVDYDPQPQERTLVKRLVELAGRGARRVRAARAAPHRRVRADARGRVPRLPARPLGAPGGDAGRPRLPARARAGDAADDRDGARSRRRLGARADVARGAARLRDRRPPARRRLPAAGAARSGHGHASIVRADAGGQAANVAAWAVAAGARGRLITLQPDDPGGRLALQLMATRGVEALGPTEAGRCGSWSCSSRPTAAARC